MDIADHLERKRGEEKFRFVLELFKEAPASAAKTNVLRTFKQQKKKYQKFSKLRNTVAHSKLVGLDDERPGYLKFISFERVRVDELAMDSVPIEEVRRRTAWGQSFDEYLAKCIWMLTANDAREPK
ncbi:MAG: hypothetical protein AB3N22_00795 [Ruegeria sp.]